MRDDLKRCPFCGGEPRVFHHQNKWVGETWHIECLDDNCGCGTCHHESADIAATVWNRRIEAQAAEIERLREALRIAAIRLAHLGGQIEASFAISGTLRAEQAMIARHMSDEALAALAGKAEQ